MKARSAALQGGLAVAGLVAAYVTWQRPPESQQKDSVVMLEASKNSLERVRYEDGTRSVTVEKKDRLYVTLAYLPGKRPVWDAGSPLEQLDAGVDGGTVNAPRPPEPPPDRSLYANDRADTLWSRFTPLEAGRALGQLPAEKLSELGVTDSERRLEVTVSGVPTRFVISKPMNGLIGNYARNEKTGEVFLISSSMFNELDPNSQLLVDRRLHAFKPSEFDAFTMKVDNETAAFVQTGAETPSTTRIAPAATPDKPDELVTNWHEKLWGRLVVTEVLQKGEQPRVGEPNLLFRIEYTFKGKPKGWLEVGNHAGSNTMWARSENTLSWVGLHQGAEEIAIEGIKATMKK
ncbi:MAG: DUF4340 domain-containing protein [Archangium sp.]